MNVGVVPAVDQSTDSMIAAAMTSTAATRALIADGEALDDVRGVARLARSWPGS